MPSRVHRKKVLTARGHVTVSYSIHRLSAVSMDRHSGHAIVVLSMSQLSKGCSLGSSAIILDDVIEVAPDHLGQLVV